MKMMNGTKLNLKKIDLKFLGEENGKPCHKHILNGKEVPGCTSISGLFQDEGWKFAWPVKLMYERSMIVFKDAANAQKVISLRLDQIDELLKKTKNAWREKRDKAADSGTFAHKLIEAYLKKSEPPFLPGPEALHGFEEFIKWEAQNRPQWLGCEIQVGSEIHEFAGILDGLAIINGEKTLVDFKTSKDIKEEYNIQLAGLCICLEEMGVNVESRAILHLPKEGPFEYRPVKSNLVMDKNAFLAGLKFYNHKNIFKARGKNENKRSHQAVS